MQRDQLVFEVFSLSTVNKNEEQMMTESGMPMPEYVAGSAKPDHGTGQSSMRETISN